MSGLYNPTDLTLPFIIIIVLTILKDLMAKRLAIMVLKPGARQDWAMKPSLSSAKQMTSSPCCQSQLGMLSR